MSKKFTGPKGTRDFLPYHMETRDRIVEMIKEVFKIYGCYPWDGPAFEYLETLTRKSGEEVSGEIYVFKDKSGRELGLRFELTASIARMIASNPSLKKPIKGFSIGKVWRYENPQQGRYREFLQMDADIFGANNMLCEVELLDMAKNILGRIGFDDYYIQLNNRKILAAQVRCAGIDQEKELDVFRALDKLNKIGPGGVRQEFLNRGMSEKAYEDCMRYIITRGTNQQKIDEMRGLLAKDEKGIEGLNELSQILGYAKEISLDKRIIVDYTLVRGLDYYTGPIFEIKIGKGEQVGSIAGGGRYDQLIELFGGTPTPAVGISFGIERIIDLVESNPVLSERYKGNPPLLLVIYLSPELSGHAFRITEAVRQSGLSADIDLAMRSFKKQIQYANEKGYPYVLFVGEDEIRNDSYGLKDMKTGEQETFGIEDLIKKLKELEISS